MTPRSLLRTCPLGVALLLLSLAVGPVASRPDDKAKDGTAKALPDRNPVNLVDKGLSFDFSVAKGKAKNVKWQATLGKQTYGAPVVAGGRVFIGTNNENPRDRGDVKDGKPIDKGVLMCFSAKDGSFLWQATHDKLDMVNDWPQIGICSRPVVEGDRLYYVSNACRLVCADINGDPDKKGKAKIYWTLDMHGKLGVFPCNASNSSPLIVGDLVFVVTSNGTDPDEGTLPAPDAPSFLAVDKKTGAVAWKRSLPGKNILKGQWSSPTAAKVNGKWQVIFPGGDGWLYAFEADIGKLVWKFDCNPKKSSYKKGGRGDRNYLVAAPVVYDNKLYIGVGQDPEDGRGVGHLWCIDITKETKNKDKDLSPVGDNFDPKAKENKDSGLVWHYGGPVIPKPKGGNERESRFERTISNVAVVDGLVYAAELSGYLHCLDAKTGEHYWIYDFKDDVWASPYYVDGKVLLGTASGDFYVFNHGKKLVEPKKIDMNEPLKTTPVVADGVLYIATQSKLFAIALKK
jgi:outer membrane protein assembly factor BamB